ncbi:ABC transporter permease subunit, partial [Burkholderia gladioli]|uniref:ABC transporter permease subunit n=1 Tax=Burkholderia gladioli TaxID=28095 RepID=UPI003132D13C
AAFAVALPLGIGCAHRPAWRATLMPVLNVVQTIPSIALFGIDRVDPGVVEAAAAMGMTRRQRVLDIELALALPVILAGLR